MREGTWVTHLALQLKVTVSNAHRGNTEYSNIVTRSHTHTQVKHTQYLSKIQKLAAEEKHDLR